MSEKTTRRIILALGIVAAGELTLGRIAWAAKSRHRVLVWSEGTAPKEVYPQDIRGAVAEGLKPLADWDILTATITDPEQGISNDTLSKTDVLIWWGHQRHEQVKDEHVAKIVRRVKDEGMGFIALHSSHYSKPLKTLLGTDCGFWDYACDGSSVRITVKDKNHPIARGIQDFTLAKTERYCEPFRVPPPESVVFDGRYRLPDGIPESSRQGLAWTVGKGRVFYFQPGHETYPHFFDETVRHILRNAVEWCAPQA